MIQKLLPYSELPPYLLIREISLQNMNIEFNLINFIADAILIMMATNDIYYQDILL